MNALDKAIKNCDRKCLGNKVITIYLYDDNGHLESLLNAIKEQSRGGHCLTITLDQGKEKNQNFCFDGDGCDAICEIEVK
mgnify:FL=1